MTKILSYDLWVFLKPQSGRARLMVENYFFKWRLVGNQTTVQLLRGGWSGAALLVFLCAAHSHAIDSTFRAGASEPAATGAASS